ncbi:MAG: YkgJ family cysteine cluster protein [Desulfomonilaceae bacterium]
MNSGDNCGYFSGTDFGPRLKKLYQELDATYSVASNLSDFNCDGCDGTKCCTVDLIIHTSVEMSYMRQGLLALDQATKSQIKGRSLEIVEFKRLNPVGPGYRNSICSANFGGRCAIYEHRPMICRLAGIPHFIDRPDQTRVSGPGCPRFETVSLASNPELKIDRTPFYRRLAEMEIETIRTHGKRTHSLTIAQILAI